MRRGQVFDVYDRSVRARWRARREVRRRVRERRRVVAWEREIEGRDGDGFPVRVFPSGGSRRVWSGWGATEVRQTGVKSAAHTVATAFPFVAGPSLGARGVYVGRDVNGGGAFCFDPWEAYMAGHISGMSMLLFGTVGMGKSSLAKSLCLRLVMAGRKLAVASDLKGEWTPIVRAVGGVVIQVGPGAGTRLNPLDPGVRPRLNPLGESLTDGEWELIVRTRRMSIMETVVKILTGQAELTPSEHAALEEAIDYATRVAGGEGRVPVIPDVVAGLGEVERSGSESVSAAAESVGLSLQRMVSGNLAGMFDGESSVVFARDVPAVSLDTSAMRGAAPVGRRVVSACCAAWLESMVTTSEGGQRMVVYEEGWDALSSRADLARMVENWKLSRAYGIFNILIMHKVSDLQMAGDQGSQMAAMAKSLLADADVKVIYRQDPSALRVTMEELELNDEEKTLLKQADKGVGLWRVGQLSFEVMNELSVAEVPLLNTDARITDAGGDGDWVVGG